MSVDLERQLAAYGEHLEMLAASTAPDTETLAAVAGSRTHWRGIAVAVAAAAVVFLVIGSIALLSPFSGDGTEMVTDPATPSTVPGTTVPVLPTPDVSAPGTINSVSDLALAPDGTIWAATRGGVVRWDAGASIPVVYGEEDGLPAAGVDRIVVAADGTVWAAGDGWVAYYDGTWQSVETHPDMWFDAMAADTMGGVWVIGIEDNHVLHINRDGTEQISIPENWDSFNAIAVDDAGQLWMVSGDGDDGVVVYDGSSWREYTTADGLPGHVLSDVDVAPDGTVWIATEAVDHGEPDPGEDPNVAAAGVASFDGETWTTYTTADGLASNEGEIAIAPDGTVWVIHGDAVSRLDGDTWTTYDVAGSLRWGAAGGSDGALWLGTNNGIVHFDGATTTRYVVPVEMTPATVLFSLEPVASAALLVDAGSFGQVTWQKFDVPTGHSLTGGIDTAHGFAAIGGGSTIRTTTDGVNWTASEPPVEARHLVASEDDLYALGGDAVRLAWTGTTWEVVDELSIPDPGPEIRSESGYLDFAENMAFGDGATVMTARSRVFFSTDGHTFVPALRGPDLKRGYDDNVRPVFATGSEFITFAPRCQPVIWTSNDGSTWEPVSTESPFGSTSCIVDIAERDGRFVAIVRVYSRNEWGGETLWASENGLTWNQIPPESISGSITSEPWAIAAGEAGWVALFGDAGTHNGVHAMYSLDGLDWAVVADELPDFSWAWGTPDVAVGTDRILVTYYAGVALIGEITR